MPSIFGGLNKCITNTMCAKHRKHPYLGHNPAQHDDALSFSPRIWNQELNDGLYFIWTKGSDKQQQQKLFDDMSVDTAALLKQIMN